MKKLKRKRKKYARTFLAGKIYLSFFFNLKKVLLKIEKKKTLRSEVHRDASKRLNEIATD